MEKGDRVKPKVIAGLRLFPGIKEASRRDGASVAHLNDCKECMRTTPAEARRMMRCGYEDPPPPHLDALAQGWTHPAIEPPKIADGEAWPPVCVGYATKMPEVLEVVRARRHWDKGELASFCGDDSPSDDFLAAIEILDGSVKELELWAMQPPEKRGI